MKSYLTSFATVEFEISLRELARTALHFGIDEIHPWNVESIQATDFYRNHRALLDAPRGSGYFLWKPYIVSRTLDEMHDGDVLVYADASISVVKPLLPLFELCREKGGILLFAGHYDGVAGQPNICRVWTKRDCFVSMDCDTAGYHDARMLDAAFLVLVKNQRSQSLVREWLRYSCRPEMISDAPNTLGLPNLPGFLEHRHDQSILSLLAARHQFELFRSPSQFGNHCKLPAFREPGEWTRQPHDARGVYANSPYPTLLLHHRQRTLFVGPQYAAAQPALRLIAAQNRKFLRGLPHEKSTALGGADHQSQPKETASGGAGASAESAFSQLDILLYLCRSLRQPVRLLELGGAGAANSPLLCHAWRNASLTLIDTSGAEPAALGLLRSAGHIVHSAPGADARAVDGGSFQAYTHPAGANTIRCLGHEVPENEIWKLIEGREFNVIVSHAGPSPAAVLRELQQMHQSGALDPKEWIICWTRLDGMDGWAAFRSVRAYLGQCFGSRGLSANFGWVKSESEDGQPETAGFVAFAEPATSGSASE